MKRLLDGSHGVSEKKVKIDEWLQLESRDGALFTITRQVAITHCSLIAGALSDVPDTTHVPLGGVSAKELSATLLYLWHPDLLKYLHGQPIRFVLSLISSAAYLGFAKLQEHCAHAITDGLVKSVRTKSCNLAAVLSVHQYQLPNFPHVPGYQQFVKNFPHHVVRMMCAATKMVENYIAQYHVMPFLNLINCSLVKFKTFDDANMELAFQDNFDYRLSQLCQNKLRDHWIKFTRHFKDQAVDAMTEKLVRARHEQPCSSHIAALLRELLVPGCKIWTKWTVVGWQDKFLSLKSGDEVRMGTYADLLKYAEIRALCHWVRQSHCLYRATAEPIAQCIEKQVLFNLSGIILPTKSIPNTD